MVKFIPAELTYPIRLEILRKGKSPDSVKFEDDLASGSFHLGKFMNDDLVSVASFSQKFPHEFNSKNYKNSYQLRGMATLDEFQGKGFGKELLEFGERILIGIDCDLLWFNARIGAVDFYKNSGFEIWGSKFMIEDVGEHFFMFKEF